MLGFVALLLAPAAAFSSPGPAGRVSALSRSALLCSAASVPVGALTEPQSQVLYDGQCMVCLTNKAVLTFFDKRKQRLEFVNVRDPAYSPSNHGGVSYEDAMRHFHVIDQNGVVHEGSDAIMTAYSRVGLGWLMAILRFPLIRIFIDALYSVVSRHRYTISRFLPGGKALATAVSSLKDVNQAAQGYGCEDEEECMLPYDDDEDDVA